MVVSKSAPTLLDHLSAAAGMATLSPVMEGIARTITSVRLTHITASSNVSIRLVGLDVIATLDFNSTLISELVLVSIACVSLC